jgi:hypothetical protein
MPEPNHMPPRLHLLVVARCLRFVICLGMDTLDFSFFLTCSVVDYDEYMLVLASCFGRLVWSLASTTLTTSMAPAATPQWRVHRAATAVVLMSLCLVSKSSLLSFLASVVPWVVLLSLLLRYSSLWPDCLGSVVVDARMIDAYCLIYPW